MFHGASNVKDSILRFLKTIFFHVASKIAFVSVDVCRNNLKLDQFLGDI